jgi:steroid 5-alpha reductase family enzyme
VNVAKLYVRGTVSNLAGVSILASIAYFLDLGLYVAVAGGLQLAVFLLHGLPQSSEKFYDLSGSFTHFAVVAASLMSQTKLRTPRQLFVAIASVVWMTRLGTFLYSRILRDGKDARFDHIKPVWLSFMGAWTIQAVWVTLIQLPVVLLNDRTDAAGTGSVDVVLMALWLFGFLFEAAADTQKMVFRDDPANKHRFITTGLWQYSRHPNYFGEILMWSCMAGLASVSALHSGILALHAAWLSPAFTAVLLLRVSGVPMVEKAGQKKWGDDPAYQQYMKSTSCILPWFPAGENSEKKD